MACSRDAFQKPDVHSADLRMMTLYLHNVLSLAELQKEVNSPNIRKSLMITSISMANENTVD
jgi:hypothetical protein